VEVRETISRWANNQVIGFCLGALAVSSYPDQFDVGLFALSQKSSEHVSRILVVPKKENSTICIDGNRATTLGNCALSGGRLKNWGLA